jgi:hypothetical protein
MSTYEKIQHIPVSDLPSDYQISYHQIRGYDSPDKWYEVTFQGERIGVSSTIGFHTASDALKFAREHNGEQTRGEDINRFAVRMALMATRSNA